MIAFVAMGDGKDRWSILKEVVVVLRGVEGRIEIDEVHRLVLEVAAEDVEVVAVIQSAHGHRVEIRRCVER
jgi:hypothetical protein